MSRCHSGQRSMYISHPPHRTPLCTLHDLGLNVKHQAEPFSASTPRHVTPACVVPTLPFSAPRTAPTKGLPIRPLLQAAWPSGRPAHVCTAITAQLPVGRSRLGNGLCHSP